MSRAVVGSPAEDMALKVCGMIEAVGWSVGFIKTSLSVTHQLSPSKLARVDLPITIRIK